MSEIKLVVPVEIAIKNKQEFLDDAKKLKPKTDVTIKIGNTKEFKQKVQEINTKSEVTLVPKIKEFKDKVEAVPLKVHVQLIPNTKDLREKIEKIKPKVEVKTALDTKKIKQSIEKIKPKVEVKAGLTKADLDKLRNNIQRMRPTVKVKLESDGKIKGAPSSAPNGPKPPKTPKAPKGQTAPSDDYLERLFNVSLSRARRRVRELNKLQLKDQAPLDLTKSLNLDDLDAAIDKIEQHLQELGDGQLSDEWRQSLKEIIDAISNADRTLKAAGEGLTFFDSHASIREIDKLNSAIQEAEGNIKGLGKISDEQSNKLTTALDAYKTAVKDFNTAVSTVSDTRNTKGEVSAADMDHVRRAQQAALEAQKRFNEALRETQRLNNSGSSDFTKSSIQYAKNLATVEAKLERMSWLQENFSRAFKDPAWAASFNSIKKALEDMRATDNIETGKLQTLTKELSLLEAQARATGNAGKTFSQRWGEAMTKFTNWMSVSSLFMEATHKIREMYDNTVAINTAMTDLRKVTTESESAYDSYLTSASRRSAEMGTKITDYIAGTTEWARLGEHVGDATKLGEVSAMYYNVGDGIDSVSDATLKLNSALKAFNLESNQAMNVMDMLNHVGNNFAITSGGLGDIIERGGAAMATANTSLERTLALGTAGNEILNNPERVGNGLKTLALRLRGSTIELQEAGEEIDEYVTSTSKMQGKIKAITKVDIMSSPSEYKDVYTILDEIAQVYDSLADVDKAALTEALFGKNQANLGTAILTNFKTARKVLKDLESGAAKGSATKEYDKWLESLEAKIGKLGSTFERASITLFDDELLGNAIDGLSTILSIVSAIVETAGSFASLSGLAGAALGSAFPEFATFSVNKETGNFETIFGSTRREKAQRQETLDNDRILLKQYLDLKSHGEELTKQQDQLKAKMSDAARIMVENGRLTGASMNKFIGDQQTAIDQTNVLTQSFKALGSIAKSVGATLGNMAIGMVLGWAIGEVFELINESIHATEIAIEKSDAFFSDLADSRQKMEKAYDVAYGDTAKRYAELAQNANVTTGGQGSLSTEEYAEFVSLGQEIAAQFPTLISGWDEQGRAVLRLKGSVEELTAALAKEYETIARGENLTNLKEFKQFGFEGAYAKLYNQDTGLFLRKQAIDALYSDLSSSGAFEAYIREAQSDNDLSRRLSEMMGYLHQDVDISDLQGKAVAAGKLAREIAKAEGVNREEWYKIYFDAVKEFWIQNSVEVMTRINTARLELEAEFQAAWNDLSEGVKLAANETVSKIDDQKQSGRNFVGLTNDAATMFKNMVASHYLNADTAQELDEQTEYFQNYNEEIQAILISTTEAGEATRVHLNNLAALQTQYAEGTITAEQYEAEVQKINEALVADPATSTAFDNMVSGFVALDSSNVVGSIANETSQLSESLDALTESYTKFTEARTAGLTALSALSEKGYLTPEETQQIADAGLSGAIKRTQYGSAYVDYQEMRRLDKVSTNAEIEKQMEAIRVKTEEANEAFDALYEAQAQGNLAELNNQKAIIDTRKKEIEQINLMIDALEGSLSALNAFKQASSMGELGDSFRASKDALDAINDGLESGRVGTNKFAAAVELMFGENVLTSFRSGKTSRADLQKMMKSVGGFYDEDGNINRDAAFKRFIDADIGRTFTGANGEKRFAFEAGTTMADVQKALGGVSEEMATYFLDAINEFAQGEHERLGPADYLANYEERMKAQQNVEKMAVQAGSVTINADKIEDGSTDEDRSAKDAKDRDKDQERQKSTVAQEIADTERARNMTSALQTIFGALQITSEETLAKDREESNRKKIEEATRRAEAEERARYAEHLAKEAKGRDQDLERQKSTVTQNAIEEEARNKRLDLITESRERAERAAAEAKLRAEQEAAALAKKQTDKKKVYSVLAGETSPADYQKEQFQRAIEQFEQDIAEAVIDAYKQGSDSPLGIMDSAGLKSFMGKMQLQAMQAMIEMTADTTSAEETNDELVEDIETEAVKPTSLDTTTAEQQSEALHATVSKGVVIPVSLGTPTNYPGVGADPRSTPTVKHAVKVDGGVAYADGNTLVGELAPEIIVDRKTGTWRLAEYPQLTHLNAGDIVFNGKQTKAILNGRKTGFSKTVGGSSFAEGTVKGTTKYKDGTVVTMEYPVSVAKMIENGVAHVGSRNKGSSTTVFDWGSQPVGTGAKGGKGSGGGGSSGGNEEEEEKEWYDWIVKLLEKAKKATEKAIEDVTEKIGYIAKNAQIDVALKENQSELEKNQAATDRYMEQADLIARRNGLSDQMVSDIQNGKIDISEYDQDMVEKINEYEEWYEKAEDVRDTIEELKKQELELQRQKLETIDEYYDHKIDRLEARLAKNSGQIDKKVAYGQEITASDYTDAISATQEKINELQAERAAYQKQFDELVASGVLKPDSDAWHEFIGVLEETDEAILEAQVDLSGLKDELNNLPLTNLQYVLDRISALRNQIEAFQRFHDAQGTDNTANTYESLIQNGFKQINNLQEQNVILREQQKGLDINSEKWQEIQAQIESNEATIWDIMAAQEGWNDSIADLKIDKLQKQREELEKSNDELQRKRDLEDALEELEKARTQRTKLVYREGIGFVYESDQNAIREAQNRVDELRHQELLDKIDDEIETIESLKAEDNVYDYTGSRVLNNFDDATARDVYDSIKETADTSGILNGVVTKSATENTANQAALQSFSIQIGDLYLNGVQDVDALSNAIIHQLPNTLLQKLYK